MKYRQTILRFLVYAIALTVLIASEIAPSSFALSCSAPNFDGGPSRFGVGPNPRSIALADFNHDAKLDQAVANLGTTGNPADGSVSILMNNGAGGFSLTQTIPIGIEARSIVTADFNNDTNPDLAVLHYVSGNCCISTFVTILLSNAAGTFAAGAPIAVGNSSSALTTADFNKDGKADLAATSSVSSGSAVVMLGNGAGGFAAPTTFPVGGNLTSIVSADVNTDTKPDLVIGNLFGFDVAVLLGDGAGGFGAALKSNTGAFIQNVAIGDFNQDSKPDVVTATTGNTLAVVLGNGDGTFVAPMQFTVPSSPRGLAVRDFNHDSRLDLATTSDFMNNVSVLLGNGTGGFVLDASYLGGAAPFYVASGDFDGDGSPDLSIANTSSNDVSVLTGGGLGHFFGHRSYSVGLSPFTVASGDFNNDSKVDLVATNFNQNSVSVLLGTDGFGRFGPDSKFIADSSPKDVKVADFNEDGKLDLVVTSFNFDSGVIMLGVGNGAFMSPTPFAAGHGAFAVVATDLNEDGHVDLASVSNNDNDLSILLGHGDGTFSAPFKIIQPFPVDLAAADLNGDGHTDLVIGAGDLRVLFGNGAGDFAVGPSVPGLGAGAIALDDVNGDGFVDAAVVNANISGGVSILLGDGSGGFGAPNNLPVTGPFDVAFGDFNSDGKTDLAATNNNRDLSVWLGDGAGMFGSPTAMTVGTNLRSVLAADVSGDQRTDLVVADMGSSTIEVLQNTCFALPVVPPTVAISNATVAEGASGQTNATFTVSLSASSDKTVAVSYHTMPASANSGVDYQAVSGRVLFPPGTTSRTVSVPVNGDAFVENDEAFKVQLSDAVNASLGQSTGTGTILNDDGPGVVSLSSSTYTGPEDGRVIEITVQRSGNAGAISSVEYSTNDTGSHTCSVVNGGASSRCDFESASGTLTFGVGETSKSIFVLLVDDSYAEGNETFSFTLGNRVNLVLGSPSSANVTITDNETTNGPNPIDQASFFVRQHYLDFLNRHPDAGGVFWTNQITECEQPGATCSAEVRRINVSAAFFLSIEFQETGYLAYRTYKAAYGNVPGTPVPVRLNEFLPETQQLQKDVVVGQIGWEDQLESNKVAFFMDFVSRARFTTAYPTTLTPAQFVDMLFANAGVTPSAAERNAAIGEFSGAANTSDVAARARALRRVAENATFKQQETNRAFVLMQYFGYLRRNPNDPPEQNLNFDGYNFWLAKLNQFNGNFVNAEMVKAFIISGEYRQRFGP